MKRKKRLESKLMRYTGKESKHDILFFFFFFSLVSSRLLLLLSSAFLLSLLLILTVRLPFDRSLSLSFFFSSFLSFHSFSLFSPLLARPSIFLSFFLTCSRRLAIRSFISAV